MKLARRREERLEAWVPKSNYFERGICLEAFGALKLLLASKRQLRFRHDWGFHHEHLAKKTTEAMLHGTCLFS